MKDRILSAITTWIIYAVILFFAVQGKVRWPKKRRRLRNQ